MRSAPGEDRLRAVSTSGAVPASILHGRRLLAANALLALTYVVLGRVGLEIAHYQANATLVWPPTGVALAALVLWGPRLWPGLFVGALLVNLSVPTPLPGALGIAVGNTLEAVLGSLLLVRVARFDAAFARTRDVLTFLAIGAFGCTLLSATIGTATLGAIGALEGRDAGLVWLIWWLGDVGGAVLVAPVVFVLARGRPRWSALAARVESWIVLSLVIVSSVAAFGPWLAERWLPAARALLLLLFPLLAWAGMRLGPRGAVTAAALAGAIAAVATAAGVGPFAGPSVHESLLVLWAYGTGLGACAAILAAAVAEREAAEAARRKAESELRAIEVRMERAQRLETIGVLASGVAHDFNNILTIVRANAEVAAAGAPTEIAPALADIEEAAARAGGLCKQLLDYAGGSVRRPEAVRLDELALDVRRMLRGGIPKKVTLDAGVDEAWVLADRQQMQQVVMNLVINAAEAIGAREGRVGLRVRVLPAEAVALERAYLAPEEVPARWVSLEVEDDGEGMDEATTRRVFDPFFTTKEHGRGLGLAALLGIVRAHGGALLVESRKGAGTRFTVLLPEGHPSDQEASEAPAGPAADKTVLIAEDEPAVREVASAALRRAGFRVHAAADGREALALFLAREAEIDAVLLDVDMPGVDGREALEAIRARRPDVAAVVTSGLGEARAPEGEHAVFLAKPYDGRQLLAALGRAIESRAAPPN